MPTVLRIGPYRFFFFSNEGTEPPHIHVESGGSHAKYWLLSCELARSSGYNAHELTRIRAMVVEKSAHFVEKWHEYFGD